jgi:hypothetical protein
MVFNSKFVAIVLLQVMLFFIFISIFFFTYAATTEKYIVQKQINYLIDQTIGPILNFICKNNIYDCSKIQQEITKNLDPNSNEIKSKDSSIDSSNKNIIIKTAKILLITSVIIIGIILLIYFLSKNNKGFFKSFKLSEIFVEAFIILIFVGITEFVFLTYFGSRYISIDINKIKIALLQKIKNYLYNNE